jgi:hypothetical protein
VGFDSGAINRVDHRSHHVSSCIGDYASNPLVRTRLVEQNELGRITVAMVGDIKYCKYAVETSRYLALRPLYAFD